jgi:hypothetical protein
MHNDRKLPGEGPHDAGDFPSQPHSGWRERRNNCGRRHTANPTLTIAALSLRAADQVKATLTH